MRNRGVLNVGIFALAVALALVVGSFGLMAVGAPVLHSYKIMIVGALGSFSGFCGTLVYTIPVAFCALAALIAFRMQLWNIGTGGQLIMGALGAAFVALDLRFLPGPLLMIAVILGGAAAGALWALIPALLRVWVGVNEMLSTLMLNYIAVLLVDYLVFGPWIDPAMRGWPFSRPFPANAMLPSFRGTGVHLGLLLVILAAVALHYALQRSVWGLRIKIIGYSPAAARYAGISTERSFVLTFLISGALAGLAGVGQVAGMAGRLYHLTPDYGYTGILVAWLSGLNPLAAVVLSAFYGALLQGGASLRVAETEPSLVLMIQAAVVIFTLAGLTIATRIRPASLDETVTAQADGRPRTPVGTQTNGKAQSEA